MIQLMLILSIFGDIISLSLPLKGVNEHIKKHRYKAMKDEELDGLFEVNV